MAPGPKSTQSPDRRRKPRFDVEGVRGGVRLPMDARVVDLSLDGFGVETDRWLQVGRRYTVSLPADDGIIRLSGTVAWCRLARTVKLDDGERAPVYKAGIEFHELDGVEVEHIESLLTLSASSRSDGTGPSVRIGLGEPVSGRFRSRREEAVNVAFEHTFSVRKISLSGLLIEADLLPDIDAQFEIALEIDHELLEATVRVASIERTPGKEGAEEARIGLEFVELDAEQRRRLRELVQREMASSSARYFGNPDTGVYHLASCRHAVASSLPFRTRRQAEAADLRPAGCCGP